MVYEALWRGQRVAVKCLPRVMQGAGLDVRLGEDAAEQHAALVHEIQLCCRFRSERLVKVCVLVCASCGVCMPVCGRV